MVHEFRLWQQQAAAESLTTPSTDKVSNSYHWSFGRSRGNDVSRCRSSVGSRGC